MEAGRPFKIIRRYHMYVESKKKQKNKLISLQNSNRLRDRKYIYTHIYIYIYIYIYISDQISHSVVSDSLQPHESQHARPPCPSPTPGVH